MGEGEEIIGIAESTTYDFCDDLFKSTFTSNRSGIGEVEADTVNYFTFMSQVLVVV